MFCKKNKQIKGGFTLVELLVVIAIIGLLSSVVLASLNSAREKGRDASRIGDMSQIRIALELYFDDNESYPAGLADLVTDGFLPVAPDDPTGVAYSYAISSDGLAYHLGIELEGSGSVLDGDADCNSETTPTVCRGFSTETTGFLGADPVYDLIP